MSHINYHIEWLELAALRMRKKQNYIINGKMTIEDFIAENLSSELGKVIKNQIREVVS